MLNRKEGTYQINPESVLFNQTEKAYNYEILGQRPNGTVFISPTTSIKRGKVVTMGTISRLVTWVDESELIRVD